MVEKVAGKLVAISESQASGDMVGKVAGKLAETSECHKILTMNECHGRSQPYSE
jgi:hypothetical protein